MNAMTREQFAEMVLEQGPIPEPFKPFATYNRDGDCIEFFAAQDMFYAERIDDLVTVYYSFETNEIVGSLIKGVEDLLEECPALQIVISDRKVRLSHLFMAHLFSRDQIDQKISDVRRLVYRKLIRVAEDTGTEADLELATV